MCPPPVGAVGADHMVKALSAKFLPVRVLFFKVMISKYCVGNVSENSIQSSWLNSGKDKHRVKWVTISAIRFGLVEDTDRQTPETAQLQVRKEAVWKEGSRM